MPTVVFQGDSITDFGRNREAEANNSAGLGTGYVNLASARWLAARPGENWRMINRGISGNRVVDLYARWKIDALNLNPDLISILIGVNDVWHEVARQNGVEADRFEVVYRMLLEWTKQVLPQVKLILCEPFTLPSTEVTPEFAAEVVIRAKIVKKLAGEFGTGFIGLQKIYDDALRQAPAAYWLPDGVHPSPAGHALLADAWLEAAGKLF